MLTQYTKALAAAALVVLLVPICVYVWVFGFHLSNVHARWAEFGSAMSGVYTPVVALATLAVLVMQVSLQKQVHNHDIDQTFVQQTRADTEFYVRQLSEALTVKLHYGNQAVEILLDQFQPPSVEELDSSTLRTLAAEIEAASPRIYAL